MPNTSSDNSIPPCNRDAATVEDVYNVHDIIPADKLEHLSEKADELVNSSLEKYYFYNYIYITLEMLDI